MMNRILRSTEALHWKRKEKPLYSLQSGFTLTEVMFVIAIIGILSAIAIPATLNWLPNMRLQSAARNLVADMQNAKSQAIKTNTNVTFAFTIPVACPGGSYAFTDGNANVVAAVNMAQDDNNLCLRNPTAAPAPAPAAFGVGEGFTSRGMPIAGGNRAIVLSHANSNSRFMVTVTIAGAVTMQRF